MLNEDHVLENMEGSAPMKPKETATLGKWRAVLEMTTRSFAGGLFCIGTVGNCGPRMTTWRLHN
jgi:hypothetical protein